MAGDVIKLSVEYCRQAKPEVVIPEEKVTQATKDSVKWMVKIDNQEERLVINDEVIKGGRISLEVLEKWAGKEITIMPYLVTVSKKKAVTIIVKKVFPMLILQGKRRKGMNRSNSETAADLLYGDYTMDESGFNKLKQQLISIFVSEKKKKQEDAEKYADQRINKVRSFARKSDDNLFKIFNNEIEWYSMGKLEDVAHKMVAKMKANKGGEFSDAVLTGKVKEHDSSKSFINHVKKAIIEYLSKNKGRFENLNITDGSTGVLYQYLLDHGVQTPTFNDKISGLGITIHDVWAYQVFITDYAINGNNFTAKLEFIYWDHFGLDYPDIVNYDNDIFYSWFVLQHFKNYQPFITKIIINETCNGTF